MIKIFERELDSIQPSQLYISSEKLSKVMSSFDPSKPETLEPIPIKELDGEVIFTDGHTRAFAAFISGLSRVRVVWEDEDLDWEAYRICVGWCKKEGIHTIADLKDRVVGTKEYEELWYKRCKEMQKQLQEKRKNFDLDF